MARPRAWVRCKSPGGLWPPQAPGQTASLWHAKPAQPTWVTARWCRRYHPLRARTTPVSPQPALEVSERRSGMVWSRKMRIVRPLQKPGCSPGAKLLARLASSRGDRRRPRPLAPALPAGRFLTEQRPWGPLQGSTWPRRSSRLRRGAAPEGAAAFPEVMEAKFVPPSLRGALVNQARSGTRVWWKGGVAAPLPAALTFWGSPRELVMATASPSTVRPGQGTPKPGRTLRRASVHASPLGATKRTRRWRPRSRRPLPATR